MHSMQSFYHSDVMAHFNSSLAGHRHPGRLRRLRVPDSFFGPLPADEPDAWGGR